MYDELIWKIKDLIPEVRSNSQYYTAKVLAEAANTIEKLSQLRRGKMMYDDLTRRLRNAAIVHAGMAALMPHSDGSATAKLFEEAAEAIEDLENKLNLCRQEGEP